jgi:glycogen debranching enzyme
MKLNNIWGYGQLFGYSGVDGQNRYDNDFVGTLTNRKIEIRFELQEWVKVFFPVKGRVKFNAITGDMIDAKTRDGDFFITFADMDTLVGYSPVEPKIIFSKKAEYRKSFGVDVYWTLLDAIAVVCKRQENGLYRFSISHSTPAHTFAKERADESMKIDIEALKKARYDYFKNMPKCKDKKYERLYYKALSVQKVNVHTPAGNIPHMWTTPDRVPHRQMWLWDSVFHALAIVTYNKELAKDCIRSVLSKQREDGFIGAMMNPYSRSYETQPQVLAWGTWEVYKKTADREFLAECAPKLEGYLTWDKDHRDKNGNGLLEWLIEPEYTECKSGESGLDNSPRFEFDEDMDAMDFSAFQAQDSEYLSKIYAELGDMEKSRKWGEYSDYIKAQMNKLLWDEEDGAYYDRLMRGDFTRVLTPASFFPLMVGVPTAEQAAKMVKTLTNPELLWTKLPLATVAKNHPMYGTDMWRGGVWLNLNYFIMKGLYKYGYGELAEELKCKTLEAVNKWYKKTGVIYEFFDSRDEIYPYQCERKGKPTTPPDWRKQVHSISDFNWSSCFTLMFIQNELYLD